MDEHIDPEELAVLQAMFDRRERAVDALLADRPAEALALAEAAVQESRRLKRPEAVPDLLKDKFAQLLYRIGRALAEEHRLEEAVRALQQVVDIEGRLGNLAAQASLLSDIATMRLRAGRLEEAIEVYENQVLPLRERLGDDAGIRRVQRNVGLAYLQLRDGERCYEHLLRSVETTPGGSPSTELAVGLQTALEVNQKGLPIPYHVLDRFRTLARAAGLTELEREFAALGVPAPQPTFKRVRVFLSYAHQDREVVLETYEFLNSAAGLFDVFLDQERLYPGWKWESLLLSHLREADVLVLFLGQQTLQRTYVRKELETFLAAKADDSHRKVIPVCLPICDEIPVEVGAYQAIDLRQEHLGRQLRRLGQRIHDVMTAPATEIHCDPTSRPAGQTATPAEEKGNSSIKELWEAGQIGIDPRALRQMVNRGILKHNFSCAYREYDPLTDGPRDCNAPAVVVCSACGRGACGHAHHLYSRFCTLLSSSGSLFTRDTKLFYWCPECVGPLCTLCLGIEDDYPCPPQEVLSHRFYCPSCRKIVMAVPVLDADYEGVSSYLKEWARAGGPPGSGRLA